MTSVPPKEIAPAVRRLRPSRRDTTTLLTPCLHNSVQIAFVRISRKRKAWDLTWTLGFQDMNQPSISRL